MTDSDKRDQRITKLLQLTSATTEECIAASEVLTSRAQDSRKRAATYLFTAIRDEFRAENYAGTHGGPDSNPSSQEYRKLRDDLWATARSVLPWMSDADLRQELEEENEVWMTDELRQELEDENEATD
jgi:hypothetical protein